MGNLDQIGIGSAAARQLLGSPAGAMTVTQLAGYDQQVLVEQPSLAEALGILVGTTVHVSDARAVRLLDSLTGANDPWRPWAVADDLDAKALAACLWQSGPTLAE